MFCTQCGSPIPEGAQQCPNCHPAYEPAADVQAQAAQPAASQPKAAYENPYSKKFDNPFEERNKVMRAEREIEQLQAQLPKLEKEAARAHEALEKAQKAADEADSKLAAAKEAIAAAQAAIGQGA